MRDGFDRLVLSPYRYRVRSLIPLDVQRAIRAGCSDIVIGSTQEIGFVPVCEIDVDARAIAATAAVLRADRQLVSDLRWQYSSLISVRGVIEGDMRTIATARAALGAAPPTKQGALQ